MAAVRTLRRSLALLPVAAVLLLWEGLARAGIVSDFLLPRFTVVAGRIAEDAARGVLAIDIATTVVRALCGFAIAAVAGTTVGIAMVRSGWVRWFFDPIISVGFPTPKIALLPIFMLWLGLGDASKITMVAVACFFVIASNSFAGASGVDRQLVWSAKSLGASERAILTEIILPAATPQVVTGLQIALPIALIVTLVTEMILAGGGLGGQLLEAQRFADSVGIFAAIVEIAIAGTLLIHGVRLARRRLLRWHEESRGGAAG
ncbi:MAG: ABC transporter permease [Alphaproteobacteria bacterium]|nr:ABC transporter permease [Alphaproteobacteria bacterium]